MFSQPRARQDGFTLLELLVALVLLALLMTLVLGAFRISAVAWSGAADRTGTVEQFRTAHRALRQVIEQSLPVVLAAEGEPAFAFAGRPDALALVASLPAGAAIGGVQAVRIEARPDGEGSLDLVLDWGPFDPRAGQLESFEVVESLVLLQGLRGIELAYLAAGAGARRPEWVDTWREPRDLPLAVRLRLEETAEGDDGGLWPDEILLPLRVEAERACVFGDTGAGELCRLDERQ